MALLREHFHLQPSGCIHYTPPRSKLFWRDRSGCSYRNIHRHLWELLNGPLHPRIQVARRCHDQECCNLDHLYLTATHIRSYND